MCISDLALLRAIVLYHSGEKMNNVIKYLQGKKTYLIALGIAADVFAYKMGWVDESVYQLVLGLLGAGGLASLRSAVAKK